MDTGDSQRASAAMATTDALVAVPTATLTLTPAGHKRNPAVAQLGKAADTKQYERVTGHAHSALLRLATFGALRKTADSDWHDALKGTDGSADCVDDSRDGIRSLPIGSPCMVSGRGDVVAFLGIHTDALEDSCAFAASFVGVAGAAHPDFTCKVRSASGVDSLVCACRLLPLPTRQALQGDWCLARELPAGQERFYGRRGVVTVARGPSRLSATFPSEDIYEPPDFGTFPAQSLVALPGAPDGVMATPYEASIEKMTFQALTAARRSLQDYTAESPKHGVHDQMDSQSEAVSVNDDDIANESELTSPSEDSASDSTTASGWGPWTVGQLVMLPSQRRPTGVAARIKWLHDNEEATVFVMSTPRTILVRTKLSELQPLSMRRSYDLAACGSCGRTNKSSSLVLCENFALKCLGAGHLGCLTPPLTEIPAEDWFCKGCQQLQAWRRLRRRCAWQLKHRRRVLALRSGSGGAAPTISWATGAGAAELAPEASAGALRMPAASPCALSVCRDKVLSPPLPYGHPSIKENGPTPSSVSISKGHASLDLRYVDVKALRKGETSRVQAKVAGLTTSESERSRMAAEEDLKRRLTGTAVFHSLSCLRSCLKGQSEHELLLKGLRADGTPISAAATAAACPARSSDGSKPKSASQLLSSQLKRQPAVSLGRRPQPSSGAAGSASSAASASAAATKASQRLPAESSKPSASKRSTPSKQSVDKQSKPSASKASLTVKATTGAACQPAAATASGKSKKRLRMEAALEGYVPGSNMLKTAELEDMANKCTVKTPAKSPVVTGGAASCEADDRVGKWQLVAIDPAAKPVDKERDDEPFYAKVMPRIHGLIRFMRLNRERLITENGLHPTRPNAKRLADAQREAWSSLSDEEQQRFQDEAESCLREAGFLPSDAEAARKEEEDDTADPSRKSDNKAEPSRKSDKKTEPSRKSDKKTEPSRKPATKTEPSRKPAKKTEPSRKPTKKTEPSWKSDNKEEPTRKCARLNKRIPGGSPLQEGIQEACVSDLVRVEKIVKQTRESCQRLQPRQAARKEGDGTSAFSTILQSRKQVFTAHRLLCDVLPSFGKLAEMLADKEEEVSSPTEQKHCDLAASDKAERPPTEKASTDKSDSPRSSLEGYV
eukprot:TRINITY_DN15827_c0_g1_i1.p1 TRINITY_DN15827_c0_g1~~TRINITY_DN15827_c0_g1_i1.p1  ORF type:complete len:1126 (+),score=221.29 TRINITY_DN15827_c0_g1_i1:59-3436(+)